MEPLSGLLKSSKKELFLAFSVGLEIMGEMDW